ncbi:hypothetical protein GCM10007111_34680 [Virgibacillus kapii]|uniref:Uncharacterized protein n=1 Tax=Virgibacillus kapii TaxID=1638645 RepID=A0ABQ2DT25_9BACI|nr:hypothetical protein M948_18450 [Virgibacillus sp. CM-4]GGJ70085.1 hypothetical protein GCM10007111_34680 [Virgibacillus kapii]
MKLIIKDGEYIVTNKLMNDYKWNECEYGNSTAKNISNNSKIIMARGAFN